MTEKRIPLAEQNRVFLHTLHGDFTLTTWDEQDVLIESPGAINALSQDGTLAISCARQCNLTLPVGHEFSFDVIHGNAKVIDYTSALTGKRIEGNLHLQESGSVKLNSVEGNLKAHCVVGDIEIGAVGGDAKLESFNGRLVAVVGGNLEADAIIGAISATVGGDAKLLYHSVAQGQHAVQAGGNVVCQAPENADITFNLQYGGSLKADLPFLQQNAGRNMSRVVLGNGAQTINLITGGSIELLTSKSRPEAAHQSESGPVNVTIPSSDSINRMLESLAQQISNAVGNIAANEELSAKIHDKVERAVSRMENGLNSAIASMDKVPSASKSARTANSSKHSESVGDEERAAVLRMMEQGKISPEQAEQLLSAMDS
jgi:hypothetical protein